MKVITPVEFQTSHLLSTTATETVATYNEGTTYALGAKVIYGLDTIYESLQNSNTGNTPSTSPTFWLKVGPSNKYAMFDTEVGTQTTATSPLVVDIEPGAITNSIAFLNVTGATTLQVDFYDEDGGTVVYTKTINMDNTPIVDWYMYFFEPYDYKTAVVLLDIPPYYTGVFRVTITGAGTVGVGAIVYGNFAQIGDTQYGVTLGNRDYSVKNTDEFGNTTFVKRAYSKRMEPIVFIDNSRLRYVNNVLDKVRSTPTVWVATDYEEYDPLIVYGFYRDYDIDVAYPTASLVRLSIEGLI